eukprot:15480923-Alexandrium_andersonii.AAC.1
MGAARREGAAPPPFLWGADLWERLAGIKGARYLLEERGLAGVPAEGGQAVGDEGLVAEGGDGEHVGAEVQDGLHELLARGPADAGGQVRLAIRGRRQLIGGVPLRNAAESRLVRRQAEQEPVGQLERREAGSWKGGSCTEHGRSPRARCRAGRECWRARF